MQAMHDLTGVVMAGGMSRRLGRDKALLELGGQTLLARAVAALEAVVGEVIIVGPPERAEHAHGVRVVPDAYPGTGPLGGIATALEATATPRVLVVACDMPFLDPRLLSWLCHVDPNADITVPRANGQTEQLHAVYHRRALPIMRTQLASGDYRIDRLFVRVRVRFVEEAELRAIDPELRTFLNINTPADLEAAECLLAAGL